MLVIVCWCGSRCVSQNLDKTAHQLDANLSKIESANNQLKQANSSSWSSCWSTFMMVTAVIIMFVATFLLIQFKGKPVPV